MPCPATDHTAPTVPRCGLLPRFTRESRNDASSAGRRTADVPDGSGAAIRRMLLADESHTKGGISTMAKKAAKGGKKKGGKKR
jgi:hypothetical protein